MKKKTLFGFSSSYIDWLLNERYQISITITAAILPVFVTGTYNFFTKANRVCSCCSNGMHDGTSLIKLFENHSFLFQAIFIAFTLFVLISNMKRTERMLKDGKNLIESYIERNTNRGNKRCDEKNFSFIVVSNIVTQFYIMWIVVWILWFAYYFGTFLLTLGVENIEAHLKTNHVIVFQQIFDFLSSIALFIIYIILTKVTTKRKERKERADGTKSLWYCVLFLVLISIIWLVLMFNMCSDSSYKNSLSYQYCSLLVSAFSAISFVLVLGKLNSNYLQIPGLFLCTMYIYAIVQAYIPFQDLGIGGDIIKRLTPFATFIGKVFVMLTLCWMVDKKRLIFFIIHKIATIDEAPSMLDELDSDPVEF